MFFKAQRVTGGEPSLIILILFLLCLILFTLLRYSVIIFTGISVTDWTDPELSLSPISLPYIVKTFNLRCSVRPHNFVSHKQGIGYPVWVPLFTPCMETVGNGSRPSLHETGGHIGAGCLPLRQKWFSRFPTSRFPDHKRFCLETHFCRISLSRN